MITAKLQGRRLVLTVETGEDEPAIAPFVVTPLSASTGRTLSEHYAFAVEGLAFEAQMVDDVLTAFGAENATRADLECSLPEGELLTQIAYMWQLVGGMDSVRALLEVDPVTGEQGGPDARGKALAAFRLRMVPYLSQIRHRLELARRTQTADTPGTSSPPGGEPSDSDSSEKPSSEPSSPPPVSTPPKPHPEPSPSANG